MNTEPRSLRDTIDGAMAFALSLDRLCDAMEFHEQNSTDAELRGVLHHYCNVGRDAVRGIAAAQSGLPDRVRAMIWTGGSKPLELLRKVR